MHPHSRPLDNLHDTHELLAIEHARDCDQRPPWGIYVVFALGAVVWFFAILGAVEFIRQHGRW